MKLFVHLCTVHARCVHAQLPVREFAHVFVQCTLGAHRLCTAQTFHAATCTMAGHGAPTPVHKPMFQLSSYSELLFSFYSVLGKTGKARPQSSVKSLASLQSMSQWKFCLQTNSIKLAIATKMSTKSQNGTRLIYLRYWSPFRKLMEISVWYGGLFQNIYSVPFRTDSLTTCCTPLLLLSTASRPENFLIMPQCEVVRAQGAMWNLSLQSFM